MLPNYFLEVIRWLFPFDSKVIKKTSLLSYKVRKLIQISNQCQAHPSIPLLNYIVVVVQPNKILLWELKSHSKSMLSWWVSALVSQRCLKYMTEITAWKVLTGTWRSLLCPSFNAPELIESISFRLFCFEWKSSIVTYSLEEKLPLAPKMEGQWC